MSDAPEGWGEKRHAPSAATADGQRDTIGVWSMYNLPQKYTNTEAIRVTLSQAKDHLTFHRLAGVCVKINRR